MCWGGRIGRVGCWLRSAVSTTHTRTYGTVQPSTNSPNTPTPTQSDYEQSVTPSYALKLCSFSWPTAATSFKLKNFTFNVVHRKTGQQFLSIFEPSCDCENLGRGFRDLASQLKRIPLGRMGPIIAASEHWSHTDTYRLAQN